MIANRSRDAFDEHDFEDDNRPRRRSSVLVRMIDTAIRNPVMASGALISGLAIILIVTNALANQPMRHPSPLFNTRAAEPVAGLAPTAAADLPAVPAAAPRQKTAEATQPLSLAPNPVAPQSPPPIGIQFAPPSTAPIANGTTQLTERIQQILKDRGLYAGAVDGIAGPATSDAIRSFERSIGQPINGEISDRVLAQLKSDRNRPVQRTQVATTPILVRPIAVSAPVMQRPAQMTPVPPEPLTGSVEGRIQQVQRALNVAGYGQLRADGRFDDKTAEAIRRYEAEHGWQITGRISDRLTSALVVRSAQVR